MKPENFLLSDSLLTNMQVKIADFGLAKADIKFAYQSNRIGTPIFAAPEQAHKKQYA